MPVSVTDILSDIHNFSGKEKDVSKFLSCCNTGFTFLNQSEPDDIKRFLNGIKNKLNTKSFNAVSTITFTTIDQFRNEIETLFFPSNDPSLFQTQFIVCFQRDDESVLDYSNKFLTFHNKYLLAFKAKHPLLNLDGVRVANEMLLTQYFLSNARDSLKNLATGKFFDSFYEARKWLHDMEKYEATAFSRKTHCTNSVNKKFCLKEQNENQASNQKLPSYHKSSYIEKSKGKHWEKRQRRNANKNIKNTVLEPSLNAFSKQMHGN